jgi:hypothetical protein
MPLAELIRFDERQAIGRPRRALEKQSTCIVLQFPRSPACPSTPAAPMVSHDDDQAAGRGRDPG